MRFWWVADLVGDIGSLVGQGRCMGPTIIIVNEAIADYTTTETSCLSSSLLHFWCSLWETLRIALKIHFW